MIVLDFETNSGNVQDVIEVAACKVRKENGQYIVVETFHRYYYSQYEVNPYALAVHKLTPEAIEILREDSDEAEYVEYFKDDEDFIAFASDSETLVAHNINFELRHLNGCVEFENHLCTMKENKKAVQAKNIRGNLKNPKLIETCLHYGIDFDEEQYHSALYDVEKTIDILNCMP